VTSTDPLFLSSWQRAWQGLQAQGDGLALRDALLACYAEPQRKYHTQQHLHECLQLFDEVQLLPERPHEVEMALWFHDAIYELKSSQNEQRSADWAREALCDAGVPADTAERVHGLVLATRHTALPATRDEQVLVDIDLAILGAPPERFAEYEQQIRAEYSFVPGFLFRRKRREILRSFADREHLYSTPELAQRLEAQARTNLAGAIGR
jgi:predicted metal-dependent HD superfamily phosphohydrolase